MLSFLFFFYIGYIIIWKIFKCPAWWTHVWAFRRDGLQTKARKTSITKDTELHRAISSPDCLWLYVFVSHILNAQSCYFNDKIWDRVRKGDILFSDMTYCWGSGANGKPVPSVQTSAFLQVSHAKNPGGQPGGGGHLTRRARGRCGRKKKQGLNHSSFSFHFFLLIRKLKVESVSRTCA